MSFPIIITTIKYYQSSKENSTGGTQTNIEVDGSTLFPSISMENIEDAYVDYRKIFVKNVDTSSRFGIDLFTEQPEDPHNKIEIALGTESDTDPNDNPKKVYTDVETYMNSMRVKSKLLPNESIPIWIKRTIYKGAAVGRVECAVKVGTVA